LVQASCITGASSTGTTNSVRRIPSIRTSERRRYSASSRLVDSKLSTLAHDERKTVAGSLECRPTTAPAASSTVEACDARR
jgi:hypothetical protein